MNDLEKESGSLSNGQKAKANTGTQTGQWKRISNPESGTSKYGNLEYTRDDIVSQLVHDVGTVGFPHVKNKIKTLLEIIHKDTVHSIWSFKW